MFEGYEKPGKIPKTPVSAEPETLPKQDIIRNIHNISLYAAASKSNYNIFSSGTVCPQHHDRTLVERGMSTPE